MTEYIRDTFDNGNDELFLALSASPADGDFLAQANAVLQRYQSLADGLVPIFLRFHLSDVTTQAPLLRPLLLSSGLLHCASIVGQCPLDGGKLALEAWLQVRQPLPYRWRFIDCGGTALAGSHAQTRAAFSELERLAGGEVGEQVIRTWLYCRDIDNNYGGLVHGRIEYFNSIGLTAKTHYIASTGIEGQAERPAQLVKMDALQLTGRPAPLVEYLHAPDFLSPTHIYGVTFERGTCVHFDDRSHYFISGTASIDKDGRIVHPGDVKAQTARVLENITALLESRGAAFRDFHQAIVYLRDPADRPAVLPILEEAFGDHCAWILLQAPVCRPGWLVEIEGIALKKE